MEKLVVKNQNFEKSISNLNELSKRNSQPVEFERFKENGGFLGMGQKKVTGREMNVYSETVMANLALVNERINQCYRQFVEVYHAFETFDKEYIAGIVGSFNQAIEATKKAEDAQKDINNTVETLEKAVQKMKEFNMKVSAELSMIDCDNWRENALKHQKFLDSIDSKADHIIVTVDSYKESHNELVDALKKHTAEKRRYRNNMIASWIVTGVLALGVLILIAVVVFKIIFGL